MSEETKSLDIESLESSCRKGESNLLIRLSVIDSFYGLDSRALDTSRFALSMTIKVWIVSCNSTIRLAMTIHSTQIRHYKIHQSNPLKLIRIAQIYDI